MNRVQCTPDPLVPQSEESIQTLSTAVDPCAQRPNNKEIYKKRDENRRSGPSSDSFVDQKPGNGIQPLRNPAIMALDMN
ncbi:hypothetical protein BX592_107247 [Paraburkholderia rhizosphaerae]|uniref:Uncharacterized protein n=1 Tax=Paraburkholderia rhizosphaerae TaxID=480658 RepID=A0A4R8LV55_9BURK|nr:hypothetical protein BX592_107247 [Paraburkholderia rhizosphaerae]